MAIEWVEAEPTPAVDAFILEADHPSRRLLERTVSHPSDESAWRDLVDLYELQAGSWSAWVHENPHYLDALRAALDRIKAPGDVLEVCCGSGSATAMIAAALGPVLATDASSAMLARAPDIVNVTWLQADVRRLPFPDGAFDLVIGINAVPCPPELARVCRPTGTILWVSSFGADTPLYIEPERLAAIFGPSWAGQAGTVGRGVWCALTRCR